VLHGLGDGEEVGLVTRVVIVVEEERDDAGRGGREKSFASPHVWEDGLEIGHVRTGRLGVAKGDGTRARRGLAPRAARVAEDAAGHAGKVHEVAVLERMRSEASCRERVEMWVGGV